MPDINNINMNKKELIRQYKETVRPMGIYQIKNRVTNRVFIGSANDIHGRINRIKFQLKTGMFHIKAIQQDYNDIGEEGFSFDILDLLEPTKIPGDDYQEELKLLEEMWLEKIQPYGEGGYHTKKLK